MHKPRCVGIDPEAALSATQGFYSEGHQMSTKRHIIAASIIGMAALAAIAQTPADHAKHQAQSAAGTAAANHGASTDQTIAAMDSHMQRMREMSQKMANAKTPQEKQALMAEQHRVMSDGMKMMGQLRGKQMSSKGTASGGHKHESPKGGTADHSQMSGGMMQGHALMEKRMEMMETMMQMMMDRAQASGTK
jgi:hypothetical protein